MKKLLSLVLIVTLTATSAFASASAQRKSRKKRTETTEVPAPTPAQQVVAKPAPKPIVKSVKPTLTPRVAPAYNLTPTQADSLVALWRERQQKETYDEFFKSYILIDCDSTADTKTDSVYKARLRALASPIPFSYNAVVKSYINRYTDSRYGTISRILGMSQYYFPLIEEELLRADLPVELRALPIIESALTPTAVSPMGAAGLWQFMPTTGKSYGLEVNSLVDERRDPISATRAACRYLKDLFAIYNDWTLAIAAYNCGPGNVNKALARSGGGTKKTFWDIYDYLPRETRGYVPAFIGASYAYAYHNQHGIRMTEAPMPLSTDTVHVSRLTHFEQIASTIDVPVETLRQLNPQYKSDIIPATTRSYTLVLPQREVANYISRETEIHSKDSLYLKDYLNPTNLEQKRQESTGKIHTVKKGDTLGAIARRYHVTTTQITRWNKLKSAHSLRIGQKLRIEGR